MTSTLNVLDSKQQVDDLLIPKLFQVSFAVIVMILMVALYPEKLLLKTAFLPQSFQPIALFYVKQLSQLYPKNNDLRIALIKQQIGNGDWEGAKLELVNLSQEQNPEMHIQAEWLRYRLSYTYAYHLLPQDPKRVLAMRQAKADGIRSTGLPLSNLDLEQLGSDLLGFNLPEESLKVYLRIAHKKSVKDLNFLLHLAKVALYAGNNLVSGNYYFLAAHKAVDVKNKREYILEGLKAYQGGSLLDEGLKAINKFPQEVTNDEAMLNFLVNYALAANRADVAQEFVRRLLSLPDSTTTQ